MSEELTLEEVRALAQKARKKYHLKRRITRFIVGIPLVAIAMVMVDMDVKTIAALFIFYFGLTVACL